MPNAKQLQNLKSESKRTINGNEHQSKTTTQNTCNKYLDNLIDSSFQGVNRLFVLAFNGIDNRKRHSK